MLANCPLQVEQMTSSGSGFMIDPGRIMRAWCSLVSTCDDEFMVALVGNHLPHGH
jgi:hypothetical protein